MANGFALQKSDRLIANNFVCSRDLKLALNNIELNEEDGNQLIDHVAHCRNLETLVFPNLVRSQRSTFARRIQSLPLRSIAFRSNTPVFGEVCSLLGQTPLRTLSIRSQILSSSDTMQLGRLLSKGTVKNLKMIECTFEDMEALIRGLNTSKVSELSISAPEFPNATIGCSEVIKSLRGLNVIKVTRVHFQDATATLHGIIQQARLKQILVKVDPEYLEDSDRYSIASLMASAVRANKKVRSVGLSIFDSDNLELITTSLARSRRIKKLVLYIEDCTDRVLKLIAPLIATKKSKLLKLKLKFSTNLTYDQSTYISSIFNGTHSIRNIYLANLYADPILARFCSRRSEIQKLRLKYCKFIPSTMEYIGTIMMNSDATLQVLDLTGSTINAEQLEKLTEHVKTANRRSLKQIRVYLDEVDLSSPTEAASVNNFIRSLDQHRTLRKIDIYGAYMDEETSKLILELVTKNKIAKFNFDMIEEAENTKMIELEDKINQVLQNNRCNIRRRERLEKQISLARKIIDQSDRGDLKVLPEEIICHILDLFDEDNLFM